MKHEKREDQFQRSRRSERMPCFPFGGEVFDAISEQTEKNGGFAGIVIESSGSMGVEERDLFRFDLCAGERLADCPFQSESFRMGTCDVVGICRG